MSYSSKQLANVQNYLMYKGHSNPTIVGDKVYFYDRTGGFRRTIRELTIESVLNEIHSLRLISATNYSDDDVLLTAGTERFAVGIYQLAFLDGKLLSLGDIPVGLREVYASPV